MPQLFSRMDDMNWLTPSMADILEQGAAPPGGDGSIREQIRIIQDEFGELETPARVVNVRSTPSYTQFVLQPETVGRLGNRRVITSQEMRRSIGQMAERHEDWTLGFMPAISEFPEGCGLLLRTDEHQPLSLRRLIVQSPFRSHASTMAFTLGTTLEQQLVVRDLLAIQGLLVVGEGKVRQHVISSLLLTQILLNTPAEIRIVLAGSSGGLYEPLTQTPHSLGSQVVPANLIPKLVDGLTTEIQRRMDAFYNVSADSFNGYNALMREQGAENLPRIILILNSLSDEDIKPLSEQIAPVLRDLLLNGPQVGIHAITSVNARADLPDELRSVIDTWIIARSAEPKLGEQMQDFHPSLLRFIDAFVIEDKGRSITSVELCAVSPVEIDSTVEYWRNMALQRKRESDHTLATSGQTGLTGMLPSELATETANVPGVPSAENDAQGLLIGRAEMLAAYLGWLSVGPLRDVLGLSEHDAQDILLRLQEAGVLEGDGPMFRFVRLADLPEDDT